MLGKEPTGVRNLCFILLLSNWGNRMSIRIIKKKRAKVDRLIFFKKSSLEYSGRGTGVSKWKGRNQWSWLAGDWSVKEEIGGCLVVWLVWEAIVEDFKKLQSFLPWKGYYIIFLMPFSQYSLFIYFNEYWSAFSIFLRYYLTLALCWKEHEAAC